MKFNPLIDAVAAHELVMEAQCALMYAVWGRDFDDNFEGRMSDVTLDLILDSYDATWRLSPRARRARLNLIWKDFLTRERVRVLQSRSEGTMSHPEKASNIQDGGPGSEPTDVKATPFGERPGGGHQRETNADAEGNSSAKPVQTLAELEAQGTIGPKGPVQGVDVKTDVSGSRDYKRVPLTQEAIAGYSAVAQGGPKANDGRKK